jgi:hypothetical protein
MYGGKSIFYFIGRILSIESRISFTEENASFSLSILSSSAVGFLNLLTVLDYFSLA